MIDLLLILLGIAALAVATWAIYLLYVSRCFWPSFFLAAALISFSLIFLSAATNPSMPLGVASAVSVEEQFGSQNLPFYIAIFAYSLLSIIVTMLANVKLATLQAILFILFIPALSLYFRNYIILSALSTLGIMVACTLLSVLSVFGWVSRRRNNGNRRLCIGADAPSHLLYYLCIVAMIAAAGFCGRLPLFTSCLALALISVSLGSVGILWETNAFENTSLQSLVSGVRRCFQPRSARA